MKKIVASILTLTLLFSAAIAVSAAPNVTGEVKYKYNVSDPIDSFETKVNFDGKLEPNMDYKVTLKKSDNAEPIAVDEASLTFNSDLAKVQVGKFAFNPSLMDRDLMAKRSTQEMKAPMAIKVTPNVGENINLTLGIQPRAEGQIFGDRSYQAELDYKLGFATIGANYQNLNNDVEYLHDSATTIQFEVQPVDALKVYGEYGTEISKNDDNRAVLLGAAVNVNKLAIRGEFDLDDQNAEDGSSWMAKVDYNFTKNLTAQYLTASTENGVEPTSQLRMRYTF